MSENKKYYWLKLKSNFFTQKEIKKLRKIAGGDTYTIIYLKLQLLSLKNEGKLIFEGIEDTFIEEIALELDEDDENVKVTIMFLQKYGLLEEMTQNEFLLPETLECIGTETQGAERVREHRKNKKMLLCNTRVTNCNTEIEIEKELDIDIEIEKDSFTSDSNEYRLAEYLFKYIKKNNENAKEPNLKAWAKVFGLMLRKDKRDLEEIKTIIKWCQDDGFWFKNILSPQALRKQYERFVLELKKPSKNKRQGTFNNYDQRTYDFENLETQLLAKDKTEVNKEPFNLREQLQNLKK